MTPTGAEPGTSPTPAGEAAWVTIGESIVEPPPAGPTSEPATGKAKEEKAGTPPEGAAKKGVVRVIAFSAGGADNVFEFGMVHAFLVSDAPKPHIVAGTSSGAVVAAMLADVLQAGEGQEKGARRLAQVARFRALLAQIEQAPVAFKEASFPDFTEVSARAGLEPLDLPTQQPREKRDRYVTAQARFGLTCLFNLLLSSRVWFGELARLVRLALDFQAAGDWRWKWARRRCFWRLARPGEFLVIGWIRAWTAFRLWLQAMVPMVRDAHPLFQRGLAILVQGVTPKWASRLLDRLGFARLQTAKRILFVSWLVWVREAVVMVTAYPTMALAWLCAPPAILVWQVSNAAAHRVPVGRQRQIALRVLGAFFLAATLWLVRHEYDKISSIYVRIYNRSLQPQALASVFASWGHLAGVSRQMLRAASVWLVPGVLFATIAMIFSPASSSRELLALFLNSFGIKKDLLTTGVLHKLLMNAFDPFYFGKRDFDRALNEALGGLPARDTGQGPQGQRTLGNWLWQKQDDPKARTQKTEPILVAPVAADVATGDLLILEPFTPMIDGLSAACALTPLFAAMKLKVTGADGTQTERWLVDGACVAREPIQPVLDLMKRLHVNGQPGRSNAQPFGGLKLVADPSLVDLCVMSAFPTRRLREQERMQTAADIGAGAQTIDPEAKPRAEFRLPGTLYRLGRIFSLRATHAAKDERILITLYNAALKPYHDKFKKAFFCSAPEKAGQVENWHLRANLRELEPEEPVNLVAGLARCADDAAKRSLLLRTIADGCRASLEGLYWNKLVELAHETVPHLAPDDCVQSPAEPAALALPPCRKLQERLKAERQVEELPGILGPQSPPGVTEICSECRYYSQPGASWRELLRADERKRKANPIPVPDWGELPKAARPLDMQAYLPKNQGPAASWPRRRRSDKISSFSPEKPAPDPERPVVAVVFSGGVFRGVFQVGVLNAFCLAGVEPDVVAGASVGTIMAALAARVFAETTSPAAEASEEYRSWREARQRHRVARIAATFLAIDRLVLTDRFADFVRRLTLRVGSADFSLRDADHLFRQFDRRSWESLTRRSRRVLAGIHRLTYMDPLEVLDLLSLHSPTRRRELPDRLLLAAQDALNRAAVGTELLGAEPLEQLIKAHVLPRLEAHGATFEEFLPDGIHFLATTTNLATGELDVLGSFCHALRQPALVPGLLASSAFPAVFRGRMNWELRAGTPGRPEELVDGGIADNLPIIPVYRFLFYAGYKGWIKLRPAAGPHLLLTASLEPRKRELRGEELSRTAQAWPALRTRTGQLQYNVKVDSHRRTQADLRRIREAFPQEVKDALAKQIQENKEIELLDLHVSCVKPEWLCGTFAFHPMLGFSRMRQAESIAHGCASTLVHLYREQHEPQARTQNWWRPLELHQGVLKPPPGPGAGIDAEVTFHPKPADADGHCCFVRGKYCPFSRRQLQQTNDALKRPSNAPATGQTTANREDETLAPLERETIEALNEIYLRCGRARTHRRPRE